MQQRTVAWRSCLHHQMSNLPSSGPKIESVTDLRWHRTSSSRQFFTVKSVPTTRSHWGNRFFFLKGRYKILACKRLLHTLHVCVCVSLVYRSIEACNTSECFQSHLSSLHLCITLIHRLSTWGLSCSWVNICAWQQIYHYLSVHGVCVCAWFGWGGALHWGSLCMLQHCTEVWRCCRSLIYCSSRAL